MLSYDEKSVLPRKFVSCVLACYSTSFPSQEAGRRSLSLLSEDSLYGALCVWDHAVPAWWDSLINCSGEAAHKIYVNLKGPGSKINYE